MKLTEVLKTSMEQQKSIATILDNLVEDANKEGSDVQTRALLLIAATLSVLTATFLAYAAHKSKLGLLL